MQNGLEIRLDPESGVQWRTYFGTFSAADLLGLAQRVIAEDRLLAAPARCIADMRSARIRIRDREIGPFAELMEIMLDSCLHTSEPARWAYVESGAGALDWCRPVWSRMPRIEVAVTSSLEQAAECVGLVPDVSSIPFEPPRVFSWHTESHKLVDELLATQRRTEEVLALLDELHSAVPRVRLEFVDRLDGWCRRHGLSQRESEIVMQMASHGRPDAVARNLFVSLNTVRNHLKVIYRKAGVRSAAELLSRLLREFA